MAPDVSDTTLSGDESTVERRFTLDEANRTLPLVRRVVTDIAATYRQLQDLDRRRAEAATAGQTGDAETIEDQMHATGERLNRLIRELEPVGCVLKDPAVGLIDFLAVHDGRDVCLCWKLDEQRIEFWHDVNAGFAGRRPVSELAARTS
ncbi:MAG: DUF2203 domain-containing protein [Phycisphaerales bacterium]|nr:DUF2203 domain-containing protein [Phycisphaerales bacterium]